MNGSTFHIILFNQNETQSIDVVRYILCEAKADYQNILKSLTKVIVIFRYCHKVSQRYKR